MLVVIPIPNHPFYVTETTAGLSASDPTNEWDETVFYYKERESYEPSRLISCTLDDSIYKANYNHVGINPETQAWDFWDFQGYTNPYAFLSRFPGNKTIWDSPLTFKLTNSMMGSFPIVNVFGFFGVDGDSISIMNADGIGSNNITETLSLYTPNTQPNTAWRFTSAYHRRRSVIYHFENAGELNLTASLTGSVKVSICNFCAGLAVNPGITQVGAEISMTQNPVQKVANNAGWYSTDKGKSVIRHSLTVTCPTANLDTVLDLFDNLAGVPTMYRITADFQYMWIYGVWTNFAFLYSSGDYSYYTLEIETAAYPERLPDGWDMERPS